MIHKHVRDIYSLTGAFKTSGRFTDGLHEFTVVGGELITVNVSHTQILELNLRILNPLVVAEVLTSTFDGLPIRPTLIRI